MNLKPKISIIGCGNVGIRYAYALIISGLAREIILLDIDEKRLEGEVMDLSHGAPFVSPVDIINGDYPDIVDSDIVVVTAGKNQKQGQTRMDLAKENTEIFKEIVPKIVKYAPEAIFLIVTNPVDVLSYVTYKISNKEPSKIIGSGTVLDTARFRFLIAKHCNINPKNIHGYILGEHGDSEFAVWSKTMMGGVLFKDYCPHCKRCKDNNCNFSNVLQDIFLEVKNSAYKIIERKRETSYGIGLALVRITEAILKDENSILPVSSLVQGYLGISDVYLSLPSIVNRSGVREVLNIELDEQEKDNLKHSAQVIKDVIKFLNI